MYFSANLGVQFFPDIEPGKQLFRFSQEVIYQRQKNSLLKDTEISIAKLDGVEINFAKSGADGRTKDLVGSVRTIFSEWNEREAAADIMEIMRGNVKFLEGRHKYCRTERRSRRSGKASKNRDNR